MTDTEAARPNDNALQLKSQRVYFIYSFLLQFDDFDVAAKKLREMQNQEWFRLTDESLASLHGKVSEPILSKLDYLKDKEFVTRQVFLGELKKILSEEELNGSEGDILHQAGTSRSWEIRDARQPSGLFCPFPP